MYNILILEDDPMVRSINEKYVAHFMGLQEHQLIATGDSQEALVVVNKQKIDLILLDIYMPYMSGLEFLQKMAEENINSQIIMMTAASDSEKIKDAIDYGVLDYLIKPFSYKRFEIAMNRFINYKTMVNSQKDFSQQQLDRLFYFEDKHTSDLELPKGLSRYSLSKIETAISDAKENFSIQDIVHLTKLSRISVKKYLDYLVKESILTVEMKYLKIGRPIYVYRKKS